jgi:hypothetical protein
VNVDNLNLVVARFLDGRLLKGVTRDFAPLRPNLHIDVEPTHQMTEVRLRELKALFFVKSFGGYPDREDVRGFIAGPEENAHGRKIAVRFRDGELLCGYTNSWSPEREAFFMFPADTGSNNERVFVIKNSTAEVKAGPQAEVLAQRVLSGQSGPPTPAGTPRPRSLPPGVRPPKSDAA